MCSPARHSLQPELGFELLLPIFAAVIIGGIGDAYGALAGGHRARPGERMVDAVHRRALEVAVGFVVLILVLIIRPQGIFGQAKAV